MFHTTTALIGGVSVSFYLLSCIQKLIAKHTKLIAIFEGVLLYEMAVGKMPFRGGDENELLWNVCYEQIHYPMFLSKELTSLLVSVSKSYS